MELTRLLERQLKSLDLSYDNTPQSKAQWHNFIQKIDKFYQDVNNDRYLLERSLHKSTGEMSQIYDNLQEESRQKIQALQESEFKTHFLANMSHEIRTPMNGIMGMIELVLDTPLDEKQYQYLTVAYESGQSLTTIINAILDLSKVESGQLELEHIAFDLHKIIIEIGHMFQSSAKHKNLEFNIFYDPKIPKKIISDPIRLRQVLTNLIGNAIKFTSKGEVLLTIKLKQKTNKIVCLSFSVKDTGLGIPIQTQEKLFNPFTQADSSTTRKFGGTGLGLSISQEIIKQMNSEILINSRKDKGSDFYFNLDFEYLDKLDTSYEAICDVLGRKNQAEATKKTIKKTFNNELILLVEDNKTNQQVAKAMLAKLNISFKLAENGAVAVEIIKNKHKDYHLILMDCEMPIMDGFSATQAIRALEKQENLPRKPIIAMTARALKGDKEKCFAAQMDDYLSKPTKISELFQVIEKYL